MTDSRQHQDFGSLSMLSLGSPCPQSCLGTIVLVSSYRRAPNKTSSEEELAGPIADAQTRYRCSEGCTWVEKDA